MSTRISTVQLYDQGQLAIGGARAREATTAEKASTQKQINHPSDSPGDWKLARSLKDGLSVQENQVKNANLVSQVLNATDNALTQLQQNVQRAKELALSIAGQGTQSAQTRLEVLGEVKSIYESCLQIANLKYGDRTLFAGLKSQGPAFDAEGKYLGDDNHLEVEIASGITLPVNLTGSEVMLGGGTPEGVNIIDAMQRLIHGMSEDDTAKIQGTLEDLGKANDQLSYVRSEVGAKMESVKRAIDTQAENKIYTQGAISKIEDVDAVKVFSDLARDQSVLKSAMSTTQKLLAENPSDILFK